MIKERNQLSMEHQNNTSVTIVAQNCGFTSILVSITQYRFHALLGM